MKAIVIILLMGVTIATVLILGPKEQTEEELIEEIEHFIDCTQAGEMIDEDGNITNIRFDCDY